MQNFLKPFIVLVSILFVPSIAKADPFSAMDIQPWQQSLTAPNFTVKNLQGEEVSLEDYKGKVVLLNFWATWCFPCIKEMPDLETLWQRYRDQGFVVLGISNDDAKKQKRVKNFVKKAELSFPIALDPDSTVSDVYEVAGIPASYIINREGEAVARVLGIREWASDEAFALVEHLLN